MYSWGKSEQQQQRKILCNKHADELFEELKPLLQSRPDLCRFLIEPACDIEPGCDSVSQ